MIEYLRMREIGQSIVAILWLNSNWLKIWLSPIGKNWIYFQRPVLGRGFYD
jgi:hypothetical protein